MDRGNEIDISNYFILKHCRKRWRKRFLDYTPKNCSREKSIDKIVKNGKFIIIKEYPERGTIRVTDKQYEFVVNPVDKVIITVNAHKKLMSKDEYHRRKLDSLIKDLNNEIKKYL